MASEDSPSPVVPPARTKVEAQHYWAITHTNGKITRTCLKCNPRHSEIAKKVENGEVTEWGPEEK